MSICIESPRGARGQVPPERKPRENRGYQCIEKGYECLGDNTDTICTVGAVNLKLEDDPDDFLMVLGVDHRALGKALYSNVSVHRLKTLFGVASATDMVLAGTAAGYIPNSPRKNELLVCKITRKPSSEPGTIVIGTEFPGVSLGDGMTVALRAYLEPRTGVVPAHSVKPRMLHFTSKKARR